MTTAPMRPTESRRQPLLRDAVLGAGHGGSRLRSAGPAVPGASSRAPPATVVRGTTIMGTGSSRSIFAAVDPRNRWRGAARRLEPTSTSSPGVPVEVRPRPARSSIPSRRSTRRRRAVRAGRGARRASTSSACAVLGELRRARRRCRRAGRSRRARRAAAARARRSRGRRMPRAPRRRPGRVPIAAVTRGDAERHGTSREPAGASATGTSEECSSSFATEPMREPAEQAAARPRRRR